MRNYKHPEKVASLLGAYEHAAWSLEDAVLALIVNRVRVLKFSLFCIRCSITQSKYIGQKVQRVLTF
jgi:hypothetical protein